jgi:uncharacterized protein (TIGR00369 family)
MTPNPATEQFPPAILARLAARMQEGLVAHLGIALVDAGPGWLEVQLTVAPVHMAANGYLHAGTVVTLADTACGYGCIANLPAGAQNFTTIELKCNFMRTVTTSADPGPQTALPAIHALARLVHGGRRTQIWDATVQDAQARTLALFRCTQMILYPDGAANGAASSPAKA